MLKDLACAADQNAPCRPTDEVRLVSHNEPNRMLDVVVGVKISGRGFLGLSQNGISAHA